VLRVLGNALGLNGFEQTVAEQVRDELWACFPRNTQFDNGLVLEELQRLPIEPQGLMRATGVPIYALDAVVRRASALQATPEARPAACYLHPQQAQVLALEHTERVIVRQNGRRVEMPLVLDEGLAMGCAWIPSGLPGVRELGSGFGRIEIEKA
jgi:NADH-quinone oxidoreductase subunit G